MVSKLEGTFPKLSQGGFEIQSPKDARYNCIAWAAADTEKWWWPTAEINDAFWPENVLREEALSAFVDAFASLGYKECENEESEAGFLKIAIFAINQTIPLHAARQLPNGRWTSKLGALEDIELDLRDLEGDAYGSVVHIMKRPVKEIDWSES